jgi:hypothetical protein
MPFYCIMEIINRKHKRRIMHTYSDTQAALQALDSFPDEQLEPVCNPCRYLENTSGYVWYGVWVRQHRRASGKELAVFVGMSGV